MTYEIGIILILLFIIGCLIVLLIKTRYEAITLKYKTESKLPIEYKWTKDNYKDAESMLFKSGTVLVIKNGKEEIPVPNDIKKDLYAFVNKGLTIQENYDRMFISQPNYSFFQDRDIMMIDVNGRLVNRYDIITPIA